MSLVGTIAVNCDAEIKTVGLVVPFHLTWEFILKPEPFTTRVKP